MAKEGCDRAAICRGRCDKHLRRFLKHGDDTITLDGRRPRGGRPSYDAVHGRLKFGRGAASAHDCAHNCGNRARDWAYDYSDIAPLTCPTHPSVYSADLFRYVPLCRPCHLKFDSKKNANGYLAGSAETKIWRILSPKQ